MHKIFTAFAIAATVLFAGNLTSAPAKAWGSWVVETQEYRDSAYNIGYFNSIAGGHDLRVVVRGNPTGASQNDFERAIIELMNDRQPGYISQTTFTATLTDPTRASYKIVMIYGAKGVDVKRACADPDSVAAGRGEGRVVLTAVFCWRDERITSVHSRVAGVASIGDATLIDMTSSAMRRIIPFCHRCN